MVEGSTTVKTGYRPLWQDTPGYKTFVDTDSQKGILPSQQENKVSPPEPNSGKAREKQQGLPLPSDHAKGRDKVIGPTNFNTPGPGMKVPVRTLSVPGQEYGHPTKYDYNMPTRRPGVTAQVEKEGANPLPQTRQKNLSPGYNKQRRLDYLRKPSKKLKSRLRYKTDLKFDPADKRYRKYYRQYPERFKRKGISPYTTPAERTKAWREDQKEDAHRKGLTQKEQEKRRKTTPKTPRSRKPKPPGSTSKVYAGLENWETLSRSADAGSWTTMLKETIPPNQLSQNYGKGQSYDTGTPRTDPSLQKGQPQRAPNLTQHHQPGLLTQHKIPMRKQPQVEINNPSSGSGKVIPLPQFTDLVNNTQAIPDGRQDRYLRNVSAHTKDDVKQALTRSIMASVVNRYLGREK